MSKQKEKKNEVHFEASFARLEEILEKMNSGTVSLDDSLKLYEEADTLISNCSTRLNDAEKRIETLIKKRNGDLEMDDENTPSLKTFAAIDNEKGLE
ncbi:MAG: exodeoxyribonuclease VII small subunit [Chlamydiales bacterium]